jgi:hypothetical protein
VLRRWLGWCFLGEADLLRHNACVSSEPRLTFVAFMNGIISLGAAGEKS